VWRGIAPTFLILALDGNAWLSFMSQLLDTEGKSSQYPLCKRLVGYHYWSGCYEKNRFYLQEIKP
jgi:hypothetical protein